MFVPFGIYWRKDNAQKKGNFDSIMPPSEAYSYPSTIWSWSRRVSRHNFDVTYGEHVLYSYGTGIDLASASWWFEVEVGL